MSSSAVLLKPSICTTASSPRTSALPKDLQELWEEKYNFNRTRLKLSDDKAKEWADRTVRAAQEAEADG